MQQTNIKTLKQSINPAYLKIRPDRAEIELFKTELITLLDNINEKESEEFHKNLISQFFNAVYYKDKHFINTKGYADLVIHNGNTPKTPVGVLIEAKSPINKAEMINRENLNVKSFQELVLYYLRERKTERNFKLRYLIITNINEWYVFDAQCFEKLFYQNKNLVSNFEQFEAKKLASTSTDFFYKEIASDIIDKVKHEITYTHFNLRKYESIVRDSDNKNDKGLIALYKFLSPTHLLKLPFTNDYNQLNKDFYSELLHIMGLEEIKDKSQKLIVRKDPKNRDNGSLIENTIDQLDGLIDFARITHINQYGKTTEERLFHIALDLTITWINRILFLKLLEAQIIKYNNDSEYSFLTVDKLDGYDDLNRLFFQILARKEDDRRNGSLKKKFAHVPYLNSSLFEPTELEATSLFISNLPDNSNINLYSKSILKNKEQNSSYTIKPLEYLLRFLDAYDFSSEGSEDIQEENKPLISASVLGLIFEKINGYKDGSFFTPSHITMFMCHNTIKKTVIEKFNEVKGWNCITINDLYNKISDITEANSIYNTIRICDPAVGSGHFLVSSLNELIYLKSELGILTDRQGKRLKEYRLVVENDELIISDTDAGIFKYEPFKHESQRVQETLFHEKQTIIENCLFGVDINPNSVKICQLRLWIELLKHTYYKSDTKQLETLPNIDINIKCGNSLISRFKLNEDLNPALKKLGYTITDYQKAVDNYRNAHNKEEKRDLELLINDIKSQLKTEISNNDSISKNLVKAERQLSELTIPDLFGYTEKQKKDYKKKVAAAKKQVDKYRKIKDEIKNNIIYQSALEWRLEFPEVLDQNGDFLGFDAIIGNPPYIQLQKMGEMADAYDKMSFEVYERTGDVYCLFYELGKNLLRPNYFLSYITSNKWMRAGYGKSMRKFIIEQTNPVLLIDFAGTKVFDEATVDVNILSFQNSKNRLHTIASKIDKSYNSDITKLSDYIQQNNTLTFFDESAINSFVILSDIERSIKNKIEAVGVPLKEWDISINRGILTGYNEAFIIDGATKDELIRKDPKSEEIIKPLLRGRDIKRYGYDFADKWLICTHNGTESEPAINIDDYPDIKEYLDQYISQLSKRQDKGVTPYNLRSCAYMDIYIKHVIRAFFPFATIGSESEIAVVSRNFSFCPDNGTSR